MKFSPHQKLIHLLAILIISPVLLLPSAPLSAVRLSTPPSQPNSFESSPCMFDLPTGVVEGEDVQCGFVQVPLDHAQPDGQQIRLAVVKIYPQVENPSPDPLFMAQGGPGGSTIDTYAETILNEKDFVVDREIVLFDQRGTLYSQPILYCEEYDKLVASTIEKELTDAEEDRLILETMQACRDRLAASGDDLSSFDSLENAADIEVLRKALGYQQINLYGVSYGTLLALHYMRQFPASLRSVILDGVVPPQTNFLLYSAKTMDQSFTRLFSSCRLDPACNKSFPELEKVFFDTVEQLNQTPARMPMTDPETKTTYQNAVIDGDAFMGGLFQMLYAGSLIPALPRMIYDAHAGEFEFFRRVYSIFLFDRSMSLGMYYSVVCAEDADFTPSEVDFTGIRPQIVKTEQREAPLMLETCRIWDVQELDPSVDNPVSSEVPTLILSGGFDPITPPAYGSEAAKTLSNSFEVIFPAGGHGQALEGACQNGIIQSFLDNPSQEPDTSCIKQLQSPKFYTPKSVMDLPIVIQMLNLENGTGEQFLVLLSALLFLLSATLAVPLIWLLVRARRPKALSASIQDLSQAPSVEPSFLSKVAGWLAFLAGPTLTVFLVIWIIILFNMVMQNDNRLFFGLPALARPLFLLPIFYALLCIGIGVAFLASWLKRYWSIWTRLYYTLIALSSFVCLAILFYWGILFAFFN